MHLRFAKGRAYIRRFAAAPSVQTLRTVTPRNLGYSRWLRSIHDPIRGLFTELANDPLISIVVPTFNTTSTCLDQMIASVTAQTYGRWQLCIADGSTEQKARNRIASAAKSDPRIFYRLLEGNLGIAGNSNQAIALAQGEFLAFLDHDDTLAPFALEEVVRALRSDAGLDLFYSDEDKLSESGRRRFDPFFKPDWSPDLFNAVNYLSHFVVIRTSLARSLGMIRPGFDGAQDYDFLLRAIERTARIHHVRKVSYHWRAATGSTARTIGNKSYGAVSGRSALTEHFQRIGVHATVGDLSDHPTHYRVTYRTPSALRLRVITSSGGPSDWIRQWVTSAGWEIGDVSSDLTLFIDPTLTGTGEWLKELAGPALQSRCGVVGAEIRTPAWKIVESGYALIDGLLHPLASGRTTDMWTPAGASWWPRNLIVPSVGCCMVKSSLADGVTFEETGLLAARLFKAGLHNLQWPFAKLVSHRPVVPPVLRDVVGDDPYFSGLLTISGGRIRLRTTHDVPYTRS